MQKEGGLKNPTGIYRSNLALKLNLAKLKAEVDKRDLDKLKTVPVDLSKLNNVVNNEDIKKTVYDKLVAKLNKIDTSGFILKTKYNTDKSNLEKKISDADKKFLILVNLLKKQIIEGKIPNITNLATTIALTAVENKIANVYNLVKKLTLTQN